MSVAPEDVQNRLLTAGAEPLSKYGFAKENDHLVRRCSADVSQRLFVDVVVYGSSFIVSPGASVRSELVERIFHRTSGTKKPLQALTPTITFSAEAVLGDGQLGRIRVEGPDELARKATDVMQSFLKLTSVLNSLTGLAELEEKLNENPSALTVWYAVPYLRATRGLILAKLANPGRFRDLVSAYTARMQTLHNGFYLPKLQALIADLQLHNDAATDSPPIE